MTTKKLLIAVGSVVAALVLLVALFVGAITGIVFYSISRSAAANVARDFLRGNEKLKQDIGEVKDFGSFVTGSINTHNANGDATLNLKVIGARRTVNVSVNLAYRNARSWRVVDAYYNEGGRRIDLIDQYEPADDAPQ